MQEHLTYIHQYEPSEGAQSNTTLLLLHGTGGNENALRDLGRMILPEAGQLRPRGNVMENGMARFFRRFGEGLLDIDDLRKRAGDLTQFLQQASALYRFDGQRVYGVGFSNGANIAASMVLLYPHVFQAAVLLHPMFAFEPEPLPDLAELPIFIGAGRADPLVPSEQTEQLADLLQRCGAKVNTFWHSGGHTVSGEEVKAIKSWLEKQV